MRSSASTSPRSSRRHATAERALVTVAVVGGLLAFLAATGPDNGWDFGRVFGDSDADPPTAGWTGAFLSGLGVTLLVSVCALAIAVPLGILGGLARISRRPWARQVGALYVEVVRGTPLLVQIFVAVYCLGYATGIDDPMLL